MAYRFKSTCIGKSPLPAGGVTAVTFQLSGANDPRGVQNVTHIVDNTVAAAFTIGTAYNLYIAETAGEITAIEGAVTAKKGSSKD